MHTKKRNPVSRRLAYVFALAMILLPAKNAVAQVNVDIDITLEGITILHYFSNIDVTIDATALAQMLGYAGTEIDAGTAAPITVSASPFVGDADILSAVVPPTTDPSAVDLTINRAWAVRSITAAGTNTVTTTVGTSTMNHSVQGAGVDIEINSSQVSTTLPALGPGPSVQFPSPGLVNPQVGNIVLNLDLTDATFTGTYADGVITLFASTP